VGRLRAITRALREDPELFALIEHVEGRHATVDELTLAHDAGYVGALDSIIGRLTEPANLTPDTVISPGSFAAATAAVGCVLDGVDRALDGRSKRSLSAVRPPGHHALRGEAMGFCLFGNVALAARYARQRHRLERILIVDWDVHHGNGTQALVERDPGIHFVSMHQWPWYPGTGAAEDRGPHNSVWNVPMPPGLAPGLYVDALLKTVDAATDGFSPDLVLISAGFDSLAGDPLGGFTLEVSDIVRLTRELVGRADAWCEGRVVSALEGGYVPERVGAACVAHLRALA
jgi:acetoin utilization deacetylase AcuC-like enzyme